jgi:hypothetical protein
VQGGNLSFAKPTRRGSHNAHERAQSCTSQQKQWKIDMAMMKNLVESQSDLRKLRSETHDVFIKEDTNFDVQSHGKRCKSGVLDFSGCVGFVMLPYEFHDKDD